MKELQPVDVQVDIDTSDDRVLEAVANLLLDLTDAMDCSNG